MERRVVITGIGAVTPIGNTAEEYYENLKKGVNGIDKITKFDTSSIKATLAAELKDFDATKVLDKKSARRLDPYSVYAVYAADEAFKDSGLDINTINEERFGVMVSSGIGGLTEMEDQITKLALGGPNKTGPLFIPTVISNMAAGHVAIHVGAKGICTSIVTACASSTNSIGEAYRNIKHGYSDYIMAGGAEAAITLMGTLGFQKLTALTTSDDKNRASIPFDKERSGFVMGEGAGIVVLETLESAKARGAKIYAEIVGYGATCDAYHMTAPNPDGKMPQRAIELALEEGRVPLNEVTYINAHGTSTPMNDKAETLAIKNAFGDLAKDINISSTKSMTGHLLGAAGVIEAIAAIKCLQDNFVVPTINYKVPDEECDLNYTPNVGVEREMKYAVSTSLGFGGHNAALVFKKWEN
ncbi:MAG: beta-ketoacyl-ACP synthase II [Lachnospirales bacterium]